MQLKPDVETDADLLIDSALYIGETVKRALNAKWDISDKKSKFPDQYGQPFISGDSGNEDFYPFVEIKNFISGPSVGYFKNIIEHHLKSPIPD